MISPTPLRCTIVINISTQISDQCNPIIQWSFNLLDNFFAVFLLEIDLTLKFEILDEVLNELGFKKAADKDEEGSVVKHLGFEIEMEFRLSQNKREILEHCFF